jgi:hypothetical protein
MSAEGQAAVVQAIEWARSRIALEFEKRDPRRIISLFEHLYSTPPSAELTALYLSGLSRIGGLDVIVPGVPAGHFEAYEAELRSSGVCPVLSDGCGNAHGLYVDTSVDPRTYFFEALDFFERPTWCSASGLASLIRIAAESEAQGAVLDRAQLLGIDPRLDSGGRARPIWEDA